MKLSAIGEFGFIARAAELLHQQIPASIIGIGDDCALLPLETNRSLLVTTDMLVENIHFLRNKISPRELGYKSLAVNLSDIAAMGGIPHSAYISLAIPPDVSVEWLDEFYTGIRDLAHEHTVFILGGDTTKSPNILVINFTVLGFVSSTHVKLRSTAKVGDCICVTDYLGDSGAGLKVLLSDLPQNDTTQYVIQRHLVPRPHLREGQWLAEQTAVHAMMDVSDGIDSDIRRIMEQSHCGARIELDALPLSRQLTELAATYHWNAEEIALTGGEDYCLLVTVDTNAYEKVSQEFFDVFGRPLFRIGTIQEQSYGLQYFKNNTKVTLSSHGYDHFI